LRSEPCLFGAQATTLMLVLEQREMRRNFAIECVASAGSQDVEQSVEESSHRDHRT